MDAVVGTVVFCYRNFRVKWTTVIVKADVMQIQIALQLKPMDGIATQRQQEGNVIISFGTGLQELES